MTFEEWWDSPTDGWYLGRIAKKKYAQAAWNAALEHVARICEKADKSTHPSDLADEIRKEIGK